jgi:hypothetical protein
MTVPGQIISAARPARAGFSTPTTGENSQLPAIVGTSITAVHETVSGTAGCYVSAILMIGRGVPIGGLEDSCPSKISVRPTVPASRRNMLRDFIEAFRYDNRRVEVGGSPYSARFSGGRSIGRVPSPPPAPAPAPIHPLRSRNGGD